MTKCIQHIRDLFEYALYKFTLYFTYFTTYITCECKLTAKPKNITSKQFAMQVFGSVITAIWEMEVIGVQLDTTG